MQETSPNVGNLSSKLATLKWDLILIKWICGLIHNFSHSTYLFSTTFCLSSNCVYKILVHIYLLWPKIQNGSGGIRLNVACSAQFVYGTFWSLLWGPFTVHYQNIQFRGNLLSCATSERDYKHQHWIEMLALPWQNIIMPLSSLLHQVRFWHGLQISEKP